jgi:hypothetical protein
MGFSSLARDSLELAHVCHAEWRTNEFQVVNDGCLARRVIVNKE